MIKKVFSILVIATLLLNQGRALVFALEAQSAGEAQGGEEAKKINKVDKPEDGAARPATEANSATEAPAPSPEPDQSPAIVETAQVSQEELGGVNANGNVGDTTIDTGDANNTGNVINTANSNLNADGTGSAGDSGVSIANTDNGSGSDNSGSANIVNNDNTNQDNSANIVNNLTQASVTGKNSASSNIGTSTITTGDANVTGTVITAANTNVDGVAVSEFNIVDDHFGDYILDFAAGCISGCGEGPIAVANTGNGSDSTNTGTVDNTTNNNTTQNNDGTVTNNINFIADSGNNATDRNTGGTQSITTGDANVAANLMTFLNNNISGGVMFGVVNIFGELIGDIILPDSVFNQFACGTCGGNTTVANTNNGAGSDNNGTVNNTNNSNTFQLNDANITNNLYLEAETGENRASRNNQGNVEITTGESNVDASVLNIANMNILGSDMWLVIINEAGNWVGKLFGAPQGSVLAGSEGVEFAVDPNGQINVLNGSNGPDSVNNGTVNNVTNNNLTQTNNANVVNNINLLANTGNNSASRNNGDSSIVTGDAEAIANIVNFVNNNIAGGRLLVTFVNVFGSWTGDFLTPGSHKETSQVLAQGGTNNESSNNQNNANVANNSSNSNSQVATGNNLIAAAGFVGGSSTTGISGNGGESNINIKVAGANTADILPALTKGANEDKTTLNLAWVLLLMPILALAILGKKAYKRGLPRKVL